MGRVKALERWGRTWAGVPGGLGDRAVPRPHGKGGVVMGRSPPSLGLSPMLGGCFREARVTCPPGCGLQCLEAPQVTPWASAS